MKNIKLSSPPTPLGEQENARDDSNVDICMRKHCFWKTCGSRCTDISIIYTQSMKFWIGEDDLILATSPIYLESSSLFGKSRASAPMCKIWTANDTAKN